MSDKDTKPFEAFVPTLTSRVTGSINEMLFAERSVLFCELSILSYTGSTFASERAKAMGFTTIRRFLVNGFVGYLFANQTDLVIAFRGINIRSFDNFDDAFNIGFGPEGAHRGFRGALAELWKVMAPAVAKLRDGRHVWATGHSLGGAMALILAGLCEDLDIEAIFSFGSPRAGSLGFTSTIKTPHMRWVNHHDIVPHMPPAWKGYNHHGEEHYFNGEGGFVTGFWGRLKRLITRICDWMRFDSFNDHSIFNYRARLLDFQERA